MVYLECDNIVTKSWYQENVLLEVNKNNIATLFLNRIDKHNSLDSGMLDALNSAFDFLEEYHAENNANIRMLLLRANGKSFCAGADLNSMQQMVNYTFDENYQDALKLARVLERLSDFPCPTISVVQGNAYGGGVGLICATDFAFTTSNTSFCLSEVKLGLIPAVISPYLVSTLGYKNALQSTLSARLFNAKQAYEMNMVYCLCEDSKELISNLNDFVASLLNNGPIAMQKAKALIQDVFRNNSSDMLSKTVEEIAKIRISDEGQVGLNAFINKDKPDWIVN